MGVYVTWLYVNVQETRKEVSVLFLLNIYN
jgi:hypothetical protein